MIAQISPFQQTPTRPLLTLRFIAFLLLNSKFCPTFSLTTQVIPSDDPIYHNMVKIPQASSPNPDSTITVRWKNPSNNEFHAKITSSSVIGWIGLGISPSMESKSNDESYMTGSDMIIGFPYAMESKVERYAVHDEDLVDVLPLERSMQTLKHAHSYITRYGETEMTFVKRLSEPEFGEVTIPIGGDVATFVYAFGEDYDLSKYTGKGVFTVYVEDDGSKNNLELSEEREREWGLEQKGDEAVDGSLIAQEVLTNDSEVEEDEPLPCTSDDDDYENMIPLNEYLKFYWTVKDEDVLSAKLVYAGQAWLGFGVSQNTKGKMIGSEAIIGLPDLAFQNGEVPLKHNLDAKNPMGVVKMEDDLQTLIKSSVTQDAQYTTLKFTKSLLEEEQLPIHANSENTFIWAVGSTNSFGHHRHHGVLHLNLQDCHDSSSETIPILASHAQILEKETSINVWIAHGVFATLAWAVASPIAIGSAWFRTLIPRSWIYVHVMSNVLCFALTLIAVVIAVLFVPEGQHFTEMHHFVGLAIIALIPIQIISGFSRPHAEKAMEEEDTSPRKCVSLPNTKRQVWYLWHKLLGMTVVLLSVWQIQDGLRMFSEHFGMEPFVSYYYLWIIFVLCITVALRMKTAFRHRMVSRMVGFNTGMEFSSTTGKV